MIEYDKERQEHLEPGLFEPTADDNLLTREIPVEIKVCIFVLFSYFVTSVGFFVFNVLTLMPFCGQI